MSIDGLNVFGSLTVNGKKLTFEDFDTDKNGQISETEFTDLLKQVECDTLELSSIDTNADKIITKEEFDDFEQKVQIQEALNGLQANIAKDFTGANAQYATQVMQELKDFATEFVNSYTGKNMVEDFKAALPAKYEEIKTNILNNTPEAKAAKAEKEKQEVKSKVLDDIYKSLVEEFTANYPDLATEMANEICKKLQTFANEFIKTYDGINLEADLKAHLEEKMTETSAGKMEEATNAYRAIFNSLNGFLDENDLESLKNAAKDFLLAAVENGIILKFNGRKCTDAAQIDAALKGFKDTTELNEAIEILISSLSTESLKASVVNGEVAEKKAAEEKAFTEIKGSEYAVNPELIDWTKVDSRYFDGGDIYHKTRGDAKGRAYDEGFALLTSDGMKNQIKTQIENMLKEKGIPFEKIAQVFENVYNQTAQETLNADGMMSFRHKTWFRKAKATIDVKTLCDTFVTNFNANIAKAIDEMNASNTDMDTIDLDYSAMNTDEEGNSVAENGEDFAALYASGKTVTVKKKGADYYVKIANQLIDNMKRQMLAKAQAMCKANGIEFDNSVFDTMFNNAKLTALNAGVTGIDSKGKSLDVGSAAAGLGLGGAAVAATATEVIAGVGLSAWTCSSVWAGLGTLTIPAVGWVIGGALALGGILTGIFGSGRSSQSSLNTKVLMDTFTEQFKANFSAWVESEKAEKANAK